MPRFSARPVVVVSLLAFLSVLPACGSGQSGADGAAGPPGPAGATGPTGATGPSGPAGPTGATSSYTVMLPDGGTATVDGGVLIVAGPAGTPGAPGAAASYVVTFADGGSVTVDGGVLVVTGPAGATGAPGAASTYVVVLEDGGSFEVDGGILVVRGPAGADGPEGSFRLDAGAGVEIADGTISVVFGADAGTAVEGNDPRLDPSRYVQAQPGITPSTQQVGSFSVTGMGVASRYRVDNANSGVVHYDARASIDTFFNGTDNAILYRGRSGLPNRDVFRVDAHGGIVAIGELAYGLIPQTGPGTRMMWYPNKASFRAGTALGTEWDDANMGFLSAAFGYGTTAYGSGTLATGQGSAARGANSVALGRTAVALDSDGVAIGRNVLSAGSGSVALGTRASTGTQDLSNPDGGVARKGSFVFGDQSTNATLVATADNQFSVRATGGVRFISASSGGSGTTDTADNPTAGVVLNAGAGTWSNLSDREAKTDVEPLDEALLLERLTAMPMATWQYKTQPGVTHLGPMSQDFRAAFGLGLDERHIDGVDADGVALAAVKALAKQNRAQQAEIELLKHELEELKAALKAR